MSACVVGVLFKCGNFIVDLTLTGGVAEFTLFSSLFIVRIIVTVFGVNSYGTLFS